MDRVDYERQLDNLASANVPVEQTKEKLMNAFDLMSKALDKGSEAGHDPVKKGKLEYHRLPPEQLAGMAKIMNDGEASHPVGYMDCNPLDYWNALERHTMAIRRGELVDPDDGMSHALHAACNGMILDRMLEAGIPLVFEKKK